MYRKTLKYVAVAIAAAFLIIQLFQIEKVNPAVNAGETVDKAISVPPDIRLILDRSCADCHSHSSKYPWYAYVQPAGWFLRSHIEEGRQKLDLDTFATYNLKKQAHKLEEVCEQVESGEMPLPSYLWIHGDAKLSPSEADALCAWAKAEKGKLDIRLAGDPGAK